MAVPADAARLGSPAAKRGKASGMPPRTGALPSSAAADDTNRRSPTDADGTHDTTVAPCRCTAAVAPSGADRRSSDDAGREERREAAMPAEEGEAAVKRYDHDTSAAAATAMDN